MFTTTTTTTTTSTQASPIEPSSYYNFNKNQQELFSIPSTEDPFKHFKNFFTSTTIKPNTTKYQKKSEFSFSTNKPKTTSTTVSPAQSHLSTSFQYGINVKKSTTAYPFYKSFTTQNPYEFRDFEFSHSQSTTSTMRSPFVHSKSTKTTTATTQSTPSRSAFIPSTFPSEGTTPESITSSSTRNPIFDVYLKRVSLTTKSPYDFGNFKEYFKTTSTISTPINRSLVNLLSANSNPAVFIQSPEQT